jgi:hypothetical protein
MATPIPATVEQIRESISSTVRVKAKIIAYSLSGCIVADMEPLAVAVPRPAAG